MSQKQKIYEQCDRTGDRLRYSWLYSAGYGRRGELQPLGWRWVRGVGCRGTWVTNDPAPVRQLLAAGAKVETNGTHAAHGAPLFDFNAQA